MSHVRAADSYIRSTGGKSSGLVPMLCASMAMRAAQRPWSVPELGFRAKAAAGSSGQLDTPRKRGCFTGRPATASDARASHLPSH
eukprot:scaffold32538_cov66-Phaeocystis_antarctica.AAC.1